MYQVGTPRTLTRKPRWAPPLAAGIMCLAMVSCETSFEIASSGPEVTGLRIENATASSVAVLIEVTDTDGEPIDLLAPPVEPPTIDIPVVTVTPDGVTFTTLTPIGASAGLKNKQVESLGTGDSVESEESTGSDAGAPVNTEATVRVPGFTITEGAIACGAMVKISATIESDQTQILFGGDGTGTPGFDAGSVGESGERFLLKSVHFACGQDIVIRISDDGTSVGVTTSATARGELAVTGSGEPSPFDTIVVPATASEQPQEEGEDPVPTTIPIQIENRTTLIANVNLLVGTASGDQSFDVSVPPDVVTKGEFACGTQLTFTAKFPNTDRPPDEEAGDLFPDAIIVLTGNGTGSPGFDEASVSPDGQRILIVGSHLECGDTVNVTLLDDSAVNAPQGFNFLGVGAGTVLVVGQDEESGDAGNAGALEAEPDMNVEVFNETDRFVRVNVAGGAASLGQQLDVYVPANGESTGAVSCADRYTITAYSLEASVLVGLVDRVLIVLDGDGTGTTGFDTGSVGSLGQRLLLREGHYECGGTFVITITDPGEPSFIEPDVVDTNGLITGFDDVNGNGVQDVVPDRLGEGTVDAQ